jgi:hypothetical protein
VSGDASGSRAPVEQKQREGGSEPQEYIGYDGGAAEQFAGRGEARRSVCKWAGDGVESNGGKGWQLLMMILGWHITFKQLYRGVFFSFEAAVRIIG